MSFLSQCCQISPWAARNGATGGRENGHDGDSMCRQSVRIVLRRDGRSDDSLKPVLRDLFSAADAEKSRPSMERVFDLHDTRVEVCNGDLSTISVVAHPKGANGNGTFFNLR